MEKWLAAALSEPHPLAYPHAQVFPETFDDFVNLRPLKGVAEILANDNSWGPLYDVQQLGKNEVKVSAATYVFSLSRGAG
jgi:hypothetical protein